MAANEIILIDNQPVQLYKRVAGVNQRQWDRTAYHKRQGNCFFEGPNYCHPALNTDKLNFQFKAAYGADTWNARLTSSSITGTATSTTADHLIDALADFVSAGVQLDYIVLNLGSFAYTTVSNIDSSTDLLLNDDIFVFGDQYIIFEVALQGDWTYNPTTLIIEKTIAGTGSIEAPSFVTVDSWYRIEITINDITAGSIDIKLGNNTITTISSVGTHVVYGQCTVVPDFQIISSSLFLGEINLGTMTVSELVTDYSIGIFDLDGVYQNAIGISGGDELNIGNVLVDIEWGNFALECGSYVVGLYEGDVAPCSGQMMVNGNFTSGDSGWILGFGISVLSGRLNFKDVESGESAINNLLCTIVAGNNYTLTWTIHQNHTAQQTGSYGIFTDEGQISPSYNSASQSGTISLTFTATQDSPTIWLQALSTMNVAFDNFLLVCNDCVLALDEADSLSECYCVCDSHECTVLIEYNSTNPSFGCYFGEETMMIRVHGRIRNPETPDIDYDPFKSTLDTQSGEYANLQRKEEFVCTLAPEWVHNTLAVALSHENVFIDNIQYKRLANYQPKWGNSIELCEGLCPVAQVDQSNLRSTY